MKIIATINSEGEVTIETDGQRRDDDFKYESSHQAEWFNGAEYYGAKVLIMCEAIEKAMQEYQG